MSSTERGITDHLTPEWFERMAQIAEANGSTVEHQARVIQMEIMVAHCERFWAKRGHRPGKAVRDAD